MERACITPTCRLSFADLFEPKPDMEGRVGYRAELLFPKNKATIQAMGPMRAVHDAKIKPEWVAGRLDFRTFNGCFIDGDTKKQEGRKGHYLLRVKSGEDYPPKLILADRRRAKPSDLYAGANVRAILSAFDWEHRNKAGQVVKRGVSFNLLTLQLVDTQGERFGDFVSDAEVDELLEANPLQGEGVEGEELLG